MQAAVDIQHSLAGQAKQLSSNVGGHLVIRNTSVIAAIAVSIFHSPSSTSHPRVCRDFRPDTAIAANVFSRIFESKGGY